MRTDIRRLPRQSRRLRTSSVQTLKLSSVLGPKVVAMATSHASRPRAIRTRPTRGTLLRGSKVCQLAADPGLEPRREIAHCVRWRRSEIAQVTGAVSRRNIHAAAESDGQMRIVAADAGPFVESLKGAAGGSGVLVVECDVVMNVIADGLHARIPWSYMAEELPGSLRQPVGLTVAAAQQEHENFFRQILHGVLPGPEHDFIGPAVVTDDAVGRQANSARGRKHAVALVSERVAVCGNRNRWLGDKAIGNNDVRGP